jgi:3-oxoacyl-[acyl-carrier protein] reductase
MDLGVQGRKAIMCASSRDLGRACATPLARDGCSVVINRLDPERLGHAATEICEATGAKVTPMRADWQATIDGSSCLDHEGRSAYRRYSVMPAPTYAARRPAS